MPRIVSFETPGVQEGTDAPLPASVVMREAGVNALLAQLDGRNGNADMEPVRRAELLLTIDGFPDQKAVQEMRESLIEDTSMNSSATKLMVPPLIEQYFEGDHDQAPNVLPQSEDERREDRGAVAKRRQRIEQFLYDYILALLNAAAMISKDVYGNELKREMDMNCALYASSCLDERVKYALWIGASPRGMPDKRSRGGRSDLNDPSAKLEWQRDMELACRQARERGLHDILEQIVGHFSRSGLRLDPSGDLHAFCAADDHDSDHAPDGGLAKGIADREELALALETIGREDDDVHIHGLEITADTDDRSLYIGLGKVIERGKPLTDAMIEQAVTEQKVLSTRALIEDLKVTALLDEVLSLSCAFYGVEPAEMRDQDHVQKALILHAALRLLNREQVEKRSETGKYLIGIRHFFGVSDTIASLVQNVTMDYPTVVQSDIQQLVWRNLLYMQMERTVETARDIEQRAAADPDHRQEIMKPLLHRARYAVVGLSAETLALTNPELEARIMVCSSRTSEENDAATARAVTARADPQIFLFQTIVGDRHIQDPVEAQIKVQQAAMAFYKSQKAMGLEKDVQEGKFVMFGVLLAQKNRKPLKVFPIFVNPR